MPNHPDVSFLHPVIQGFLGGMKSAEDAKQREQELEMFHEKLDQAAEQFKSQNKLEKQRIDLLSQHAQLAKDSQALEMGQRLAAMKASGTDISQLGTATGQTQTAPPFQFPGGATMPPVQIPNGSRTLSPGGMQYNPAAFPGPQQAGTAAGLAEAGKINAQTPALAQQMGAVTKAKEAAEEPYEVLKSQRAHDNRMAEQKSENAAIQAREIAITNMHSATQKWIAKLNNDTELQKARIQQQAPSAETMHNSLLPAITAGNLSLEDIEKLYPKAKSGIVESAMAAGIKPLSKDISTQKLPGLAMMTKIGVLGERYLEAVKTGHQLEASTLHDQLVGYMGNIAKSMSGEGAGRLNDKDIERATATFPTRKDQIIKPDEMDKKMDGYWRYMLQKQKEYLDGSSTEQYKVLQNKYGFATVGPSPSRKRFYYQLPKEQEASILTSGVQ